MDTGRSWRHPVANVTAEHKTVQRSGGSPKAKFMADLSTPSVLSPKAIGRANDAARLRDLTARFELLLEQAQGFARGGDYLGAQARARFAHTELESGGASARVAEADIHELRAHLDLRLRHYDRLARDWRQETEDRRTAYLARERGSIGGNMTQTSPPDAGPTGLGSTIVRLWTSMLKRSPIVAS